MSVAFTPWPEELAARYIEKGYWKGLPLTDVITRHGRELASASRTALICQQRQFSYAELDRLSDILASRLHRQGFRAGETAVVQLPNIAEFYIVYFALLKVGIVPVNALFNHKQLELRSYVEQVQPALMVVSERHQLFQDDQFASTLAEQISTIRHWLVDGETTFGTSLSEWLEALPSEQAEISSSIPTPTPASEVAFFQLSGGSTGTPKLIPRTHNDYYYSVRASAEICQLDKDTVYLCALPAPHNFSLSSPGALGVFYAGGTVVLATDPSAMTCFPLIKQHGVTMTALVPPAVTLWLQAAEDFDHHLDSLKVLQVGGARLSESLAKQIMPILGCQLQQVFGMAEGLVNYTRFDDDNWHVFNTQGRPISEDDEIKVVDELGIQVPDGEEGALLTRGPYTFRGYFNSPDHNASAFDTDGFYRSGDIVKRTATGYLIVVGRDKDQINRGGEKIAAEEVENQLLTHDAVTNVALVAMPDIVMGEKSCAFVIAADPKLKAITLRKHLRAQGVAEYKLPDRVEFVSELPMTPVGKVDKKQLRQTIQQTLTIKKEKDV
ncbi:(2,3-dihydroxybenzoyl)adenylate synthase [Photobacterium sp. OFAV2-7]|uniref:(2,3-dihydroxybenzoyl)adenylate synthase n=1 Tax=Photobacterium sp. OFAV2-7 TaxID=2917748 RepID=UPI001EF43688|nr:(2,3-dihydroxybenzoyl)adenylate synthase [Photobacterium sp. OFAV2-7]MCG7584768.1 (2,3-dihydroxybenzoyl)adenylate synthase [Photobacterium sp. OFAV2-7]